MNVSRRGFLSSVSSAILSNRLNAQSDSTFSTEVNVVNVLVTVRDRQGKIIRNLTRESFFIDEDGQRQAIRYFSQESDLPLKLGLLVDTSGSQRRLVSQERTASYRFLDQVLREDRDRAFVIHFDHEVELLEDLTSSRTKLEAALAELEAPNERKGGGGYPGGRTRRFGGGGTLLYDAVLLASNELMKKQIGRKALVLLTDGVDVGSHVGLLAAIESAQRADTLVYSILFADPDAYPGFGNSRRRGAGTRANFPPGSPFPGVDGKKILQRISDQTGGGFFEVSSQRPIEEIYTRLEEELRNQYSIGYTPSAGERPPGYHKIRVATNRTDAVVQARDGYYGKN